MYEVTVQTAPGAGLLCRKERAILFVPAPDSETEKLIAAFDEAAGGDEMDAVAETLVESDFQLPPFACVAVGPTIALRVFGDLRLESDQRSVPFLSGVGSATWVDHVVHGQPSLAQIDVDAADINPLTRVKRGTVNAGGMRVIVHREESAEPPATSELGPTELGPSELGPSELGPSELGPSELAEYVLGAFDLPTANPSVGALSGAGAKPVVEPVAEDEAVVASRLVFDDGFEFDLTSDIVLGRNPLKMATANGMTPLTISGDKVSRAHLIVRVVDGHQTVDDCGSRNGSAVVATEGSPPMQLLSGSPQAVAVGARIYFGSRSFVVEPAPPSDLQAVASTDGAASD